MSIGKAVSELVGAKKGPASGLRVDDDLLKMSQKVGKEVTDAEYIVEQATKLNNKASLFRDGSLRAPGQKGRIGFVKLRELKAAGDERALADAFRNVSDYKFSQDGSGLGGSPLVQEAFTKPGWKHSGRQSEIVMMSPHDYLARSAKGHGLTVEELMGQLAQGERTDEILNGMFEGKQFDMPYLDHRGGNFGQEGQHRAMAAAMLGMDEIPVGMMWDEASKAGKKVAEAPVRDDMARLENQARVNRRDESGFTEEQFYHSTVASEQFEGKGGFKPFSHFGTQKAAEDRFSATFEEAKARLSRQSPNRGNREEMTNEEFFDESFAQGEDFTPRTVPVHLKIDNPLEVRDNGLSDAHSHMQAAIGGMVDKVPDEKLENYIALFKATGNNEEQKFAQIRRMLEEEGYDGLSYVNYSEDVGSTSLVPLRPQQVRSPNAEFKNPKSGSIMAGTAGAAVVGTGASLPQEADAGTPQDSVAETATERDVDWDFIAEKEGNKTDMYVPVDDAGVPLGTSGPTVGMGIDLGAWGVADLKKAGVSKELIAKLKPYTGKKKQAALDYVTANPITLTGDEVKELNKAVKGEILDTIETKFNKDSDTDFKDLTQGQQTAIASVFFQYGTNKNKKGWPTNYWAEVTEGRWEDAEKNLRAFGDDYKTRRKSEADLL